MSQKYFVDSDKHPKIVKLLSTRVLLHFAEIIYEEEFKKDPQLALRRFMISDMGSGTFQVRESIDQFKTFSAQFPFSVYGFTEPEFGDVKNYPAHAGEFYAEEIGRKVSTWQMKLTMPMISFFNRADDAQRAVSKIYERHSILARLDVPIIFNNIQQSLHPELPNLSYATSFPVNVTTTVTKANFANEFQQYLTENRIWDIRHDVEITYNDFSLSDYLGDMTVEEMYVRIYQSLADGSSRLDEVILLPDPPKVISTLPADTSTDVPSTSPFIQIVFNNGVKEDNTEFLIQFSPSINADVVWSADSKTLSYYMFEALIPNTTYTVFVPNTIKDTYGNSPEDDYTFTFTTGA